MPDGPQAKHVPLDGDVVGRVGDYGVGLMIAENGSVGSRIAGIAAEKELCSELPEII